VKFTIDLSEIEDVAKALGTSPERVRKAARGACSDVGADVLAAAQTAAPRDRPWLATQGIKRRTWSDNGGAHTDIYTVPDPEGRPVGVFVEFGTSNAPPQPFLSPQITWAGPALRDAVLNRVDLLKE
jgi:hypothetical protein